MAAGPRFTFHIGSHKTGTTYLQSMFKALAPALREHGVLVPECWYRKPELAGHHVLAEALTQGRESRLRADLAAIRDSGCPEVLVSAENISLLNDAWIERLGGLLDGAETRFVFHCRRWSDYIPSHWQTLLRGGYEQPFPAFYRQIIEKAADGPALNFGIKLDRFARVFGRDRVSIVSYSAVLEGGGNLAAHFLRTFLPEAEAVAELAEREAMPSRNTSLPFWQAEVIRGLNVLARKHGMENGGRPANWFAQRSSSLALGGLEQALTAAKRVVTLTDTQPNLRALHESLFQAWGDRLVPPRPPAGFFSAGTREVTFVRPSQLRDPEVTRLLRALFEEYLAYVRRVDQIVVQRLADAARAEQAGAA